MMLWITSDTHFGHANVIKYCDRPFDTVDEMDEELIKRWNDRVGDDDTVYHLGDFCMGKRTKIKDYLSRLKGQKILVLGNHDRSAKTMEEAGFMDVFDHLDFKDNILMIHDPMDTSLKHEFKACIHGHLHGKQPVTSLAFRRVFIDVGVDAWDYAPVPLDTILHLVETNKKIALS